MTDSASEPRSTLAPFRQRVAEQDAGPFRLLTLPTPVADVVTLRGSLQTRPDFAAGEPLLQDVMVDLFDKGTRARDRFELAELLEDRGVQLQFRSDGRRIRWSARMLKEHVPVVIELLAEQLRQPLFDAAELAKTRAQTASALRRGMESTGSRAARALTQRLYPAAHPNYSVPYEEKLAALEGITTDDVQRYFDAHVQPRDGLMVAVGDVEGVALPDLIADAFDGWSRRDASGFDEPDLPARAPARDVVHMDDKQNVDVRMGQVVPIRRADERFLPLMVGTFILGGNFSARLMTVVRDELGLTYGIRSGLTGVSVEHACTFRVAVTLSQDNIDRGIEATRREVERFVREGVEADEVDAAQTTLVGTFKVQLSTTNGLASTLLHNAERGFPVDYLDRHPRLIEALTREDVDRAVQALIVPDEMALALAGTVDGGA